jgi:hypothetical protein
MQVSGGGTAVTDRNHLTLHLSREHASAVLRILETEAHRRARKLGVTYAQWAESSPEALELAMTCYFISDWLATGRRFHKGGQGQRVWQPHADS